ncbi:MAG: rhomboid family intramembrane serine protease [Phycisphaerae bacterium]
MIIPWRVDVPQDRRPFINWLIIALAITAFVFQMKSIMGQEAKLPEKIKACKDLSVEDVAKEFGVDQQSLNEIEQSVEKRLEKLKKTSNIKDIPAEAKDKLVKQMILNEYFVYGKIKSFILSNWNLKGLFGHMWLHGGIIHLLGNMLFLWIFGNAVCAKIGNFRYLFIYLGLGVLAGISHLVFTGGNALGASGAIYGIVGMYLVLFPENEITCYFTMWLFLNPYIKEFSVSSIWMILFWVTFDIWGAMKGGGRVAYFAHLGGFAGGFVLAILMLKLKLVVMEEGYEKSLLQLISGRKGPAAYESVPYYIRHSGLSEKDLEAVAPETVSAEPAEPKAIVLEPEPPREEFIRFTCSCGKKLKMPVKYGGKTGVCPQCKLRVRIPDK